MDTVDGAELVAVRALQEQEFAWRAFTGRLSFQAAAELSALPASQGGLGYAISAQRVRTALTAYRERTAPLLEVVTEEHVARQLAELAELSRLAQAALARAAAGGRIDRDAARLLLDVHAREARLLGLDAPAQVRVETVSTDSAAAELDAMLARMPVAGPSPAANA